MIFFFFNNNNNNKGFPAPNLFQPVAIETLGSFNQSALEFLSELGRRFSVIVGDRRETAFLFQRLSVCTQRFNLVAFKGTFPTNPEDEICPSRQIYCSL